MGRRSTGCKESEARIPFQRSTRSAETTSGRLHRLGAASSGDLSQNKSRNSGWFQAMATSVSRSIIACIEENYISFEDQSAHDFFVEFELFTRRLGRSSIDNAQTSILS